MDGLSYQVIRFYYWQTVHMKHRLRIVKYCPVTLCLVSLSESTFLSIAAILADRVVFLCHGEIPVGTELLDCVYVVMLCPHPRHPYSNDVMSASRMRMLE